MSHRGHERLLESIRAASLDLTGREQEALRLMSHGLTQQMAGDAMGHSRQRVDDLLERARIKLGVKTTLHACCEAIRRGIIP